ncbi:hypothetical protein DENIS_3288 [Desulfonema ishimotonii]|uniref:Uncharacterized protein n=1 Tax=Desulfonema ishimotonii TaxID=45657 RepID=A0A401FZB1_9BACT|nr:hypothetical protein [Desulfonema ishimotonii]GBC62319.1 hypothetical protein DENIS_3288 [Desulfonema ishimotonii]
MNQVTLKQDGMMICGGKSVETGPLMFLSYQAVLEESYTLRGFFRMFEHYPEFEKLNAFLPSYMAQYRSSPESGCLCDGFDGLELAKTVEMIGFPGKPRLEIYHSLYGVSGGEAVEIRSVPLENLLDMPVRLGRLRHIVFGDSVDVLAFDTVFSLFEFIDGILWELGFQGTLMACELRR